MLHLAHKLGLKTRTVPADFEKALLKDRLRDNYVTDFADTDRESVDGAVLLLYLELFDTQLRMRIADRLRARKLDTPYPIRCASEDYDPQMVTSLARLSSSTYHSTIWLHLGLMYLNGLKHLGCDTSVMRAKVDEVIMRYHTVLETLDLTGRPYKTLFHSTEYGLSMAAGQYLELVARD